MNSILVLCALFVIWFKIFDILDSKGFTNLQQMVLIFAIGLSIEIGNAALSGAFSKKKKEKPKEKEKEK